MLVLGLGLGLTLIITYNFELIYYSAMLWFSFPNLAAPLFSSPRFSRVTNDATIIRRKLVLFFTMEDETQGIIWPR